MYNHSVNFFYIKSPFKIIHKEIFGIKMRSAESARLYFSLSERYSYRMATVSICEFLNDFTNNFRAVLRTQLTRKLLKIQVFLQSFVSGLVALSEGHASRLNAGIVGFLIKLLLDF